MAMVIHFITKEELKSMSAKEFQKMKEKYDEIKFHETSSTVDNYLIQYYASYPGFKEKLELSILHHIERGQSEKEVLENFMNIACFHLQSEVVEKLLQRGCIVDKKEYKFPLHSALFRAFTYNVYIAFRKEMNGSTEENLRRIGELLIKHGALLEIIVHDYGNQKINIIFYIEQEEKKKFMECFQSYEHLFNPVQKKQWGAIRLAMVF